MLAVNLNGVVADFGLSLIAGAYKELIARRCLLDVPVEEFIVRADFDDFEAFLDEIRAELPELFKASVAVEDGADILFRVVSGDTKVICHCYFLLFSSV